MAEIHGVFRPGHKVVNVDVCGRKPRFAVKAASSLNVQQDRAEDRQGGPLTAEQELVQIGRLAQNPQILLAHVSGPRAALNPKPARGIC